MGREGGGGRKGGCRAGESVMATRMGALVMMAEELGLFEGSLNGKSSVNGGGVRSS